MNKVDRSCLLSDKLWESGDYVDDGHNLFIVCKLFDGLYTLVNAETGNCISEKDCKLIKLANENNKLLTGNSPVNLQDIIYRGCKEYNLDYTFKAVRVETKLFSLD